MIGSGAERPGPAGARLTIDLGALVSNWRILAGRAAPAEAAAVVKADAYGIGIEPAVRALAAAGCRTFFVALPAEGLAARRNAPEATVYVLNGLLPGAEPAYLAGRLRPVLGSRPEIEAWAALAGSRPGVPPPAIHVDTGMNRLGLTFAEAAMLASDPDLLARLRPALLMSHLAVADTPEHPLNAVQLSRFRDAAGRFPGVPASLANSAGILLGRDYGFDLVRPGIALYGAVAAAGVPPLAPVVVAEAEVVQVREVAAGDPVGYGAAEHVARASRLAILSIGYADGYPRAAGSSDRHRGARVVIRGRPAPIVGRVSMDLVSADVTGIPDVRRGDWAELFGGRIAIDEVADRAGTIGYELLTRLGRRFARRYVEDGT